MTSKFVRPWSISLLLAEQNKRAYMESGEDSPSLLRRAWSRDGRSEKPIHRSMEYGILNAYWMSNLYDKDRGMKMVTLEEALALQRKGLLKVSYRFLNDPAAAAAETFEAHPHTPPEEHGQSYNWDGPNPTPEDDYAKRVEKMREDLYGPHLAEQLRWEWSKAGKIEVMGGPANDSFVGWGPRLPPHGTPRHNAGVLNHQGFIWVKWPRPEKRHPYDPQPQGHPDFPPYKGERQPYYDLRKAESDPPKTSKGLVVYPQRMAELIRDGDKTMIVKDKPLDLAGKRYTIVAKRKGYAYVQLGNMRVLTLPKFKALNDKHLIKPDERAKYFKGKRRLYAWPVKVLRPFDRPYPTNAPLRPQDVAPKLKTYASETSSQPKWYWDYFIDDYTPFNYRGLDMPFPSQLTANLTDAGILNHELVEGFFLDLENPKIINFLDSLYEVELRKKIERGVRESLQGNWGQVAGVGARPKGKDERIAWKKRKRAHINKLVNERFNEWKKGVPDSYATETFESSIPFTAKYQPIVNELQWNTDYLVTDDFLDEHFIDGGILNHIDWELVDWSNPHPSIQKRKQALIETENKGKKRAAAIAYVRRRRKEVFEEMEAEVVY